MGKETRGINLPDLVQVLFLNIRVRLYAAVCSSAYDHYVSLKRPALFLISATLKNSRFPVKVQQFSFLLKTKMGMLEDEQVRVFSLQLTNVPPAAW